MEDKYSSRSDNLFDDDKSLLGIGGDCVSDSSHFARPKLKLCGSLSNPSMNTRRD